MGASIQELLFDQITQDDQWYQLVFITMTQGSLKVSIRCKRLFGHGVPLYGPALQTGRMELLVEESLTVKVDLTISLDGMVIFEDVGDDAGMEVVGSMKALKSRINPRKIKDN